MKEKQVPSLHDEACGISMSLEKQAVSHDRGGRCGILHVSGTPFLKSRKQAGYLGNPDGSQLQNCQLCRVGRRLECCWSIVLGQGGYAKVFWGHVQVLPFRVEVTGSMTLLWRAMRPLLAPLAQASSYIAFNPLHNFTQASRDCAAAVWQIMLKTAEIWGLARPCAVKVLQDSSPSKGAYGSRSVEHEVLITMHVTSACASCPYIGKAHGFDLADKASPLIHIPSCACPYASADCPNPACTDADAVLLVLEAYTVDLDSHIELHKRHSPDCNEFPCSRCLHRPQQDESCQTLTVRAASAATAPLQALAAPINAATATACMFASAVASSTQSKDKAKSTQSTAVGNQLDSAQGQVVSLWEYATRLRESGLVMSVSEVLRIALELAEAVHALHTVAHVMHLDIKPQNVLLDSQLQVKLLDFGLSAAFKPERPFIVLQSKGRGTRPYTAPELLAGSSSTVSPAADIYSFGCCLAAVSAQSRGTCTSSGEPPDIFGLLQKGVKRSTDLSAFAPQKLHSLIKACLSEHAFERPSASQVLDELQATSSRHHQSLEARQLLLFPPTPPQPTKPTSPEPAQRMLLQPLQSFPLIQSFIGGAAQPRNLLLSDVMEQRQASPASPPCKETREQPGRRLHTSRSYSYTAGDAVLGGSACFAGVRGSCASRTQIFASPRLCSNVVADGSSASRAGVSDVWSSVCASDVHRRGALHHTTSVRFGLASVMRPLSAQSSSVSGWLSEESTSLSFASHATAY